MRCVVNMIWQTFECTSILEANLDHSLQVAGFFSLSVTGKLQFISPSPIHHWQIISSLSLWSINNYNSLFVFLSLSFLPPTHNILCLFSLCLSDSLSHSPIYWFTVSLSPYVSGSAASLQLDDRLLRHDDGTRCKKGVSVVNVVRSFEKVRFAFQ